MAATSISTPMNVSLAAPVQRHQGQALATRSPVGGVRLVPARCARPHGLAPPAGGSGRPTPRAAQRLCASDHAELKLAVAEETSTCRDKVLVPSNQASKVSPLQHACKVMAAAAAAGLGSFFGPGNLLVAPAVAASKAVSSPAASSPMMDSYLLTVSSMSLEAKAQAMIANPAMAMFPIVCGIAVYILCWGLKAATAVEEEQPATAASAPSKSKAQIYKEKAQDRVKTIDRALGFRSSPVADQQATTAPAVTAGAVPAQQGPASPSTPKLKSIHINHDGKWVLLY